MNWSDNAPILFFTILGTLGVFFQIDVLSVPSFCALGTAIYYG